MSSKIGGAQNKSAPFDLNLDLLKVFLWNTTPLKRSIWVLFPQFCSLLAPFCSFLRCTYSPPLLTCKKILYPQQVTHNFTSFVHLPGCHKQWNDETWSYSIIGCFHLVWNFPSQNVLFSESSESLSVSFHLSHVFESVLSSEGCFKKQRCQIQIFYCLLFIFQQCNKETVTAC